MSVITSCKSCGMEIFTNPPLKPILCDKCEENKELKDELLRAYQHRGEPYWAGEKEWIDRRIQELKDELKS